MAASSRRRCEASAGFRWAKFLRSVRQPGFRNNERKRRRVYSTLSTAFAKGSDRRPLNISPASLNSTSRCFETQSFLEDGKPFLESSVMPYRGILSSIQFSDKHRPPSCKIFVINTRRKSRRVVNCVSCVTRRRLRKIRRSLSGTVAISVRDSRQNWLSIVLWPWLSSLSLSLSFSGSGTVQQGINKTNDNVDESV